MSLPAVGELHQLYAAADEGAIAALLAKLAVEKSYVAKLDETRQARPARTRPAQGVLADAALGGTTCRPKDHVQTATGLSDPRFAASQPTYYGPGGIRSHPMGKGEMFTQALTHRTTAGLKEFRLMHAAHFRAHNKIIFPPTLRLLPLWTLGEAFMGCDSKEDIPCVVPSRSGSARSGQHVTLVGSQQEGVMGVSAHRILLTMPASLQIAQQA